MASHLVDIEAASSSSSSGPDDPVCCHHSSSETDYEYDLPSTVRVLEGKNGNKVYLVGTAHFSRESQDDVSKVIRTVRPNIVVVELCSGRAGILQMTNKEFTEEVKSMSFSKMKSIMDEQGTIQGLLCVLLLRLSKQLTEVLGMAPGGEFRRAFKEVSKIPGCILHFGDRPLAVTIKRAVHFLSWWDLICLSFSLMFTDDSKINEEFVEKCKNDDVLDEMFKELAKYYPGIGKVFLNERDIYLTYSLQVAAAAKLPDRFPGSAGQPATVVGIVGIGHLPGIVKLWGTVTEEDFLPICGVPPPSRSTKILKFTIKLSLAGLVVYGASRFFPSLLRFRR
ncbi:unnamed protein product [Bemisia tabaci]|uniref:TraB domain-containing protein n=1 Tax=Bemisia tabaci TaxID=7038 RepID=A0A9P0F5A6_BEMTA|nr:PREDICTED: traB domain-containing protein [Bemisia tabaci]XP_018899003.1 PREDICTED: traB domain-containing protein [Bemisia tabaci]CAH0389563.1 unnamed protein product [Bemisia tabaci]